MGHKRPCGQWAPGTAFPTACGTTQRAGGHSDGLCSPVVLPGGEGRVWVGKEAMKG